jgi:hypothetical protein
VGRRMMSITKIFSNTGDLSSAYDNDFSELNKINIISKIYPMEQIHTIEDSVIFYELQKGTIYLDKDTYYVFYGKKRDFDKDIVKAICNTSINVTWISNENN